MTDNADIRNVQKARRATRASEGISAVQPLADASSEQASDIATAVAASFDVTYIFPAKDFGAGNWAEVIEGHATKVGVVQNVAIYDVTETFNAVTTPARVEVGVSGGDVDGYVISASLGTTAANAAANPALTAGALGNSIPATTNIQVGGIAPTGGTPAGIATVAVTIKYT